MAGVKFMRRHRNKNINTVNTHRNVETLGIQRRLKQK
jgi:hypothetical protein